MTPFIVGLIVAFIAYSVGYAAGARHGVRLLYHAKLLHKHSGELIERGEILKKELKELLKQAYKHDRGGTTKATQARVN